MDFDIDKAAEDLLHDLRFGDMTRFGPRMALVRRALRAAERDDAAQRVLLLANALPRDATHEYYDGYKAGIAAALAAVRDGGE